MKCDDMMWPHAEQRTLTVQNMRHVLSVRAVDPFAQSTAEMSQSLKILLYLVFQFTCPPPSLVQIQ